MTTPDFEVKDSGVRHEYDNGFVRDTEDGKYDYARLMSIEGLHLVPLDMLERFCAHMVKGAAKYGEDNWTKARGAVALGRFARSLCRHVVALITGKLDEDHAAAVWFNTAAYARVQSLMRRGAEAPACRHGDTRRANGSKHARACLHPNPDHAGGCLDQRYREAALSAHAWDGAATRANEDLPDGCDNPAWHTRRGCRCFNG